MKNEITNFVLKRLNAFKTHGGMYGSPETVEFCAIQLLEVEYLSKYSQILEECPRIVIEAYVKEVTKRYNKCGNQPFLYVQLYLLPEKFHNELYEICMCVRKNLGIDT